MGSPWWSVDKEVARDREDRLVPVSGLQHMVFCPRQAALIHVDRIWADNHLTVEGSHMHRNVDEGTPTMRDGVRTLRGLHIRSLQLGLVGKADSVELHPVPKTEPGVVIDALGSTRWRIVPVEYKRGRPKRHRGDEVQLCAQAICLEEAFEIEVPRGFLFYGQSRRRTEVSFGEDLRRYTADTARAFHEMVDTLKVPVRERDARCERCSLLEACMPRRRGGRRSARRYLREWIHSQSPGDSAS